MAKELKIGTDGIINFVEDRSLDRKASLLSDILVETEGQWRSMWTALLE